MFYFLRWNADLELLYIQGQHIILVCQVNSYSLYFKGRLQ